MGDDPNKSLLSSNRIKENAEYVFLTRYQQSDVEIKPHPAAAKTIQLGLALSNLNGVDYDLPTFSSTTTGLGQGEFIQTRNQDRFTTEVNDQCDNPTYWTEVMTAGRACGAFPLAFRPLVVQREWATPDYQGLGAKNWADVFTGAFSYADGGIFNNYPLGLARDLSLRVDTDPADADKRYYFYISPDAKVSTTDYKYSADNTNMVQSMGQIVKSILSNSRFQDWVKTDSINGEIEKLHRRAKALLEVVNKASEDDLQSMGKTAAQFCEMLYVENGRDYQKDFSRAKQTFSQYITENQSLTEEQRKIWIDAVLVMEVNANLMDKDKMRIYTMTASPDELASSPLAAFFGFLDVRFRIHDYLVGRLKARQTINHIIESVKTGDKEQLPLHIAPLDIAEIQQQLDGMSALRHATMKDVSVDTRKKLYERLKNRSQLILKEVGLNIILRTLLEQLFLKGRIKKFLML